MTSYIWCSWRPTFTRCHLERFEEITWGRKSWRGSNTWEVCMDNIRWEHIEIEPSGTPPFLDGFFLEAFGDVPAIYRCCFYVYFNERHHGENIEIVCSWFFFMCFLWNDDVPAMFAGTTNSCVFWPRHVLRRRTFHPSISKVSQPLGRKSVVDLGYRKTSKKSVEHYGESMVSCRHMQVPSMSTCFV